MLLLSFLVRNNRLNNYEADTALGKALISLIKVILLLPLFNLENIINDFESTSSSDLALLLFRKNKITIIMNMEKAQKYIGKYLNSSSKNILHEAASKITGRYIF